MTDDDTLPAGKIAQLRLSISNLCQEFGTADVQLAVVINVGLALLGVVLWWATSGWFAYLGVAWALLNILPVIEWVIRG